MVGTARTSGRIPRRSGAADGADAVRGSEVYRFELKWQEVARLYKNILFDKATPSPPRMLDDLIGEPRRPRPRVSGSGSGP